MRGALVVVFAFFIAGSASATTSAPDWRGFNVTPSRSGVYPYTTGITAANVRGLARRQVRLDGTVDSSAIYVHGLFVLTTTYGRTEAINAATGAVRWRFTPPGYSSWAGSARITTATPIADPTEKWIYAASPGGSIYKLSAATGRAAWGVSITRLPSREKIASALNYANGRVIATTGGYIGDAPPYQGHVAILDGASGRLLHVWNSLCSNRSGLIDPHSCGASDSAIWGRAGAVVDPATGDLLVATGNGPWDGATNWGDAVIRLSPDATTMRGNYTPTNTDQLNASDTDIGSTSPVVLDSGHIAEGGKDGKIRVLGAPQMAGTVGHKGGELQVVSTPGSTDLFTAPAVWNGTVFVADGAGTDAWRWSGGKLTKAWGNGTAGTSPVVAGGLLWIYDPNGGLNVYQPTTGRLVATLACGPGHWNSPIVVAGRVALPEGNANDHSTSGVLDIWSLRR
ncbi:MAG TPA: PQQ-binding-like beta-propeller repeat protein [Gaiellaceae bacterium]|nr:PQQ-binding-like beta-propeller repeat protein [Gaiellaceae bacterium]